MSFPFSFWKFSPRQLAGMQQWFEADYGVALSPQGVFTVADRSGNGRTLTGAGGAGGGPANPTLGTGGVGNRPFFQFVSANSQQFTFPSFNPGNTFFSAAVFQGANAGIFCELWTGGGTNRQLSTSNANGGITCFSGVATVKSNPVDVSTKAVLVEINMNAGTGSVWVNGVSIGMTTASGLANTMSITTIGQVLGFFSDMNLYAGIIYTTLPTANQQLQLREYFRSRNYFSEDDQ